MCVFFPRFVVRPNAALTAATAGPPASRRAVPSPPDGRPRSLSLITPHTAVSKYQNGVVVLFDSRSVRHRCPVAVDYRVNANKGFFFFARHRKPRRHLPLRKTRFATKPKHRPKDISSSPPVAVRTVSKPYCTTFFFVFLLFTRLSYYYSAVCTFLTLFTIINIIRYYYYRLLLLIDILPPCRTLALGISYAILS